MIKLPRFFRRPESRSQALVEFALFGSIFVLTLRGLLDFGIMMSREQTFTNAAREGASFAAKSSDDNVALGLQAALMSCTSSLTSNDFYTRGGIIIVKLARVSSVSTTLTNSEYAVFGFNGSSTGAAILQSKVLSGGVTNKPSTLPPALVTNITYGKYLYACEIFYSNQSQLYSYGFPDVLYDKSYFVSP